MERKPIIAETVSKIERVKIAKNLQVKESQIKRESHWDYEMELKPVETETITKQEPIKWTEFWQIVDFPSIQSQGEP
jgi:hypothetical protein